mmetsp:Transcript_653/g.1411  ORF Transcript_653/g.1411 Transcript_653/m.1411 type:complete len:1041 (-) Transcript_653:48-3170(-)
MVRDNWEGRIERTERRRTAAKLKKENQREHRLNKGTSSHGDYKASYGRLEEWLDDKGVGIGVLNDDNRDVGDSKASVSCIAVDIWTDASPENRPEYLPSSLDDVVNGDEYDDEDGHNKKGRSKGKQEKDKQHRGGFKKKGKAHPNANNKQETEVNSKERSGSIAAKNLKDERLCGQEFFYGRDKCKGTQQYKQQKGGKRRGRGDSIGGDDDFGCSFQHYHQLPKVKCKQKGTSQSPPMTVAQVLNEKFQPHHIHHRGDDNRPTPSLPTRVREAALKSSFNAAVDDANTNNKSCMDMVYHSRFLVDNKVENGNIVDNSSDSEDSESVGSLEYDMNNTQKSKVNEVLQHMFKKEKLPTTSLVYLTVQGVLIYDRYREGLVVSEKEERFLLFGDAVDDVSPGEDIHNDVIEEQTEPMRIHQILTHHLLDEILSYCGDEGAAILPQVCSSWRDVGTQSPQLWKVLLGRHDWPLTVDSNQSAPPSDTLDECQQFRSAFISHYSVVRDVRALADACNHIIGGSGGSTTNDKHGFESAMQIFKATKGAPVLEGNGENLCTVKIWSGDNESASTRALAAYDDCTLRLFEVVRGNSSSNAQGSSEANINCRQLVCVRAAPPSKSRKRDSCEMKSMDLDSEVVVCFVEELHDQNEDTEADSVIPWMAVFSRDDLVCAGNEGMLEDDSVRYHDLRAVILDFLLDVLPDSSCEELREALSNYLAMYDGNTSDIHISVTPKLVACGKGHFLFHAFIHIPGYSELPLEGEESHTHSSNHPESRGHRLFLFSTRHGRIVKSLHLTSYREATSLFASRPFRRRAIVDTPSAMCTNVLVSGPTMALLFISVEVKRDGTVDLLKKSMIENEEFAPWSTLNANLTSSHAIFSTDPVQGPVLHFQRILSSHGEMNNSTFDSIEIGGRNCRLHNMLIIRELYIVVSVGHHPNNEEEEDASDGEASFEAIIYYMPTLQEIYRCPLPSEALSIDCIGDTLAMNVSNLGFAISGGNARDVARTALQEDIMTSPSGKNAKEKKKRLVSGATGKKKNKAAHKSRRR